MGLWFETEQQPRYKRQLENVNHLVLDTIHKKGTYLTMPQLETILDALWEWRVIE